MLMDSSLKVSEYEGKRVPSMIIEKKANKNKHYLQHGWQFIFELF